jgi:hypothetical protein
VVSNLLARGMHRENMCMCDVSRTVRGRCHPMLAVHGSRSSPHNNGQRQGASLVRPQCSRYSLMHMTWPADLSAARYTRPAGGDAGAQRAHFSAAKDVPRPAQAQRQRRRSLLKNYARFRWSREGHARTERRSGGACRFHICTSGLQAWCAAQPGTWAYAKEIREFDLPKMFVQLPATLQEPCAQSERDAP